MPTNENQFIQSRRASTTDFDEKCKGGDDVLMNKRGSENGGELQVAKPASNPLSSAHRNLQRYETEMRTQSLIHHRSTSLISDLDVSYMFL